MNELFMLEKHTLKILFVINTGAGSSSRDWSSLIAEYFVLKKTIIEIYDLQKNCTIEGIKEKISQFAPSQVVAVGGDGTVKLVAESLIHSHIPLGILPAGSANGLAKELGISNNPEKALETLLMGVTKKVHLTNINEQLCIHLSDIGLNAYAMKKFKHQGIRGMWGYLIASLKVLWQNPLMQIEIETNGEIHHLKAEMIVIANATQYGSGAVINPIGKLDDGLFEVVVLKKISPYEIFKMTFLNDEYDAEKIEIFQTTSLKMRSVRKVHFQIDGEYLGKVKEVNADIIPDALEIIVPEVS